MQGEQFENVVLNEQSRSVIGRSVDADIRLFHISVSNRHAIISRDNNTFLLEDLDSKYGTFVNETRIARSKLNSGDRVRFGTSTTLRVTHDGLHLDSTPQGIRLKGDHITVWNKSRGRRSLAAKDLNFVVEPNSFVGILGPSGCGKSTLLDVLATCNREYSGSIRVDDAFDPREQEERYRDFLGHVPQKDLIHNGLTVRESFEFMAELRGVDPLKDVDRIIEQVGMSDDADKLCEVLSGGQKKRLCVGHALLRRPRLLLLDEPTAGLDPGMECNLMARFSCIASQGTTVVCTTHSMDNVHLFDRVIVLGTYHNPGEMDSKFGKVEFVGPPAAMLQAQNCGNFTDLYLKLGQKQLESNDGGTVDPIDRVSHKKRKLTHFFLRANPLGSQLSETDNWQLQSLVEICNSEIKALNQTGCLLRRSWTKLKRANWDNGLRAFQPIALGALTSLTQFGTAKEFNVGFFCVVTAIFLGMNNSVPDLVRERELYVRETLAGLNLNSYLAAKTIMHWAVGAVQLFLLFLTVLIVGSRAFGEATWNHLFQPSDALFSAPFLLFAYSSVLFLSYAGGVAVGMTVSTVAKTEQSAVFWLPMLIMPQMLLSAVATGVSDDSLTGTSPFRPLLMWIRGEPTTPKPALVVDVLSMPLFSRPATILLDHRATSVNWGWIADAIHLVLLVLAAYVFQYCLFRFRRKMWRPFER